MKLFSIVFMFFPGLMSGVEKSRFSVVNLGYYFVLHIPAIPDNKSC